MADYKAKIRNLQTLENKLKQITLLILDTEVYAAKIKEVGSIKSDLNECFRIVECGRAKIVYVKEKFQSDEIA